ncbi:MAG TPA: exodeoxyribonuclease VII large subunit [Paludibacteraceae bacterium]|nr:exodeoxyribonuclease VII large subunit [Paludibacteraceae bacterium]
MNHITLVELTEQIQETININFDQPVWVEAEISELRENPSGHCYLDLIEKEKNSDVLLARIKANCWAPVYRILKPYFENTTGQPLRSGLKILISVTVDYHPLYGISLTIHDIEPSFTIGELALRRMEIIRQLEEEGIADMNKQLPFPLLPQRLAVISSPTAAGYGDFCDQLKNNPYSFVFHTKLFPAIMQGEQAANSIISALEKIYQYVDLFDLVVIIRGGGATADLSCFDSYELALHCAQFPLPILTGIGHQRDISILDMMAHTSLKTPTAVADFLISNLQEAENQLKNLISNISFFAKQKVEMGKNTLNITRFQLKQTLKTWLIQKNHELEKEKNRLKNAIHFALAKEQNKLGMYEKIIQTHSPAFLLKYGYTITTLKGQKITSVEQVKKGDCIQTYVIDGNFESEVL